MQEHLDNSDQQLGPQLPPQAASLPPSSPLSFLSTLCSFCLQASVHTVLSAWDMLSLANWHSSVDVGGAMERTLKGGSVSELHDFKSAS